MKRAVVFIDVQKDFIDGALGSEIARATISKIAAYAEECAKDSLCEIFATRDTHDADYLKTLEGQKLPVEHCVFGTAGWQLDSSLSQYAKPKNIINKPTFGSFHLADAVKAVVSASGDEFEQVELCGFCTDVCVVSNALILRAALPDVKIVVHAGLCAGTAPEAHAAALAVMKSCQIDVIEEE